MGKSIDQLEQSFANKSSKYWASMRTNLKLMQRAEANYQKQNLKNNRYTVETKQMHQISALQRELRDILDSGILTYPHTLKQLNIDQDTSLVDRKTVFGLNTEPLMHTESEQKFLDNMAQKADTMRKANWSWRIGQEAMEKHALAWHPFFVTLTVDPKKRDPKELWQEGREFRKYIRELADIVCKELGHPLCRKKPYNPESDYVTYAGVIEHGKSREHHHGHFVIWMRAIPKTWRQCPNSGIANPANRTKNECKQMSIVWPHSNYDPIKGNYLSPALYFRSIGDIWERVYNFALPLKDGKPMRVSKPRVAGHYITKYLSKEHKEWHHRMKSTRNLGLNRIKRRINQLDLEQATALTWRAENSNLNHTLMKIHTVPLGLMRTLAKQRVYLLKFRAKQLDLKTLLTSNSEIFTRMLKSVQNGQRPDRMDSAQFYDWVGQFLPVPKEYSKDRLVRAHWLFNEDYPPDKVKINHTKIGANEIGYT